MKKLCLYTFAFCLSGLSLINGVVAGIIIAGSAYGILYEDDEFYRMGAYVIFGFFIVLLASEIVESRNRKKPWELHWLLVVLFLLTRLAWVGVAILAITGFFIGDYPQDTLAIFTAIAGVLLFLVNVPMFINYGLLLFPRFRVSLKTFAEKHEIQNLL